LFLLLREKWKLSSLSAFSRTRQSMSIGKHNPASAGDAPIARHFQILSPCRRTADGGRWAVQFG
jgi:hypothetical protein